MSYSLIKQPGFISKSRRFSKQAIFCPPILRTLLAVITALGAWAAQGFAHAQGALPERLTETPTEIITGQSRNRTLRPKRAQPPVDHSRSDPAPFLTPLAALPRGPYYGKIKRPRKHRLDQDRDGFVSKHELDLENQTRSAAFREADQNQDGKLDAPELRRYQALIQPRGRGRH